MRLKLVVHSIAKFAAFESGTESVSYRFLLCCVVALATAWIVSAETHVSAQQTAPAPAVTTPAPAPAVVRDPNAYPPYPGPFYRGSNPKDPRLAGFYLNTGAFLYFIGLFLLWTWTAGWIDGDANSLKVRPDLWNSVVLLAGVVGFVGALCSPSFGIAFVS